MSQHTPANSAQYTNYIAGSLVAGYDWGGVLRAWYAKLTFTAAGFTTASAGDTGMIRLPAGLVRIFTNLSWIACPVGTSTADLDIGWAAYVDNTGATVAADQDGLAASLDVGGAAIDAAVPLPAAPVCKEFNSKNGVDIVASFDTANSPAAGSFELVLIGTAQSM